MRAESWFFVSKDRKLLRTEFLDQDKFLDLFEEGEGEDKCSERGA